MADKMLPHTPGFCQFTYSPQNTRLPVQTKSKNTTSYINFPNDVRVCSKISLKKKTEQTKQNKLENSFSMQSNHIRIRNKRFTEPKQNRQKIIEWSVRGSQQDTARIKSKKNYL